MEERWRGPRIGSRRVGWALLALGLLVALLAGRVAGKPKGENLHRPDGDCLACHSTERETLDRDRVAARTLLAADLEERCFVCHDNEGPSHHTGIRPRKPVPDMLPLSGEGLITCATCHFMHGEKSWKDFVRVDNSRGGLCLTCHELAELE